MPANVLILLDKSGSMGWRMSGGSSGISLPYDTTTDANGNLYMLHNIHHMELRN